MYGEVHGDLSPKRNGRRGQKQFGVDIFVRTERGLIGIQCKRYNDGTLTLRDIEDEIRKADAGTVPISRLIISTTAASDANLVGAVLTLSVQREKAGKFAVEIDFWEEIEAHIERHSKLLARYNPHAPESALRRNIEAVDSLNQTVTDGFGRIEKHLGDAVFAGGGADVPAGLQSSLDKLVTGQIDAITEQIKAARYRDAELQLTEIGKSFGTFDQHQKARWHLLRSICRVHLFRGEGAADDLLTAFSLYPNDEKIAAAGIRGLLLKNDPDGAAQAGLEAKKKFPTSPTVWAATAFALIELGRSIQDEDVPPEIADDPDVLMALCSAAQRESDYARAWKHGRKILNHAGARQPNRSAALAVAVAWATSTPTQQALGTIDELALSAISEAVACFEPRAARLWNSQSVMALPADVSNVCYAYLLLDRYDDVLTLCEEAKVLTPLPSQMLGFKLGALHALNRNDEFIAVARTHVPDLQPVSFLLVAEAAASNGAVDIVDALIDRAEAMPESDEVEPSTIRALRSIAQLHSGARDIAIQAALAFDDPLGKHKRAALIYIRTLINAGELDHASARLDGLTARISKDDSPTLQLLCADCLFFVKQYVKAAEIYQRYCVPGRISEIQRRRLRCYVEAGLRAEARQVLKDLPPTWVEDDHIREAAIELAQSAGDWALLFDIAEEQLRRRPDHAGTWALALMCERYGSASKRFHEQLSVVPERLSGSLYQIGYVASLEIQRGAPIDGLRRLYRMVRASMQSAEAAGIYVKKFLIHAELVAASAPDEKPGPGSTWLLSSEDGSEITASVDPLGMVDLPQHRGYYPPDSTLGLALAGKGVDETVEIEGAFGHRRLFKVVGVSSVYLHLLEALRRLQDETPEGLPAIQSAKVVKDNGELDLELIKSIIGPGGNRGQLVFDTYATALVPLGACAKLLNTSTLELVQGWPRDAAPLRMCTGSPEEIAKAFQLLEGDVPAIVIDLATLADLVSLGCEAALTAIPVIYISTVAVQILDGLRSDAADSHKFGRVGVVDGELQVVKYPDDYGDRCLAFYSRIQSVIDQYCTVCPAYGVSDMPPEVVSINDQLGEDEYEVLLLAAEKQAVLASVDLHLRQLAESALGVQGVWPQVLMGYAASKGLLPAVTYRYAMQLLFRSNRTLVAVDAADLLYMFQQGDHAFQSGIAKMVELFSTRPCNVVYALAVVEDVIAGVAKVASRLKVVLEIVEYLYEPLFRHPDQPADLYDRAVARVRYLAHAFRNLPAWISFGAAPLADANVIDSVAQLLVARVDAARARAASVHVPRTLPIKVLYVTSRPSLWG
ncbi:hypothetical protein H3H37_20645 [Duganella sp. LX20W]|uniref:PIN domain-containing protein n=1 Tax=Rugamonas brunnea TaxID=2758569 RepID=A0A7W2IDD6_9BURK|nr:hypothetical protein [Rugamonas brunnea]MBA5639476.1 hypothetical protein [Rugamonas brunnea]